MDLVNSDPKYHKVARGDEKAIFAIIRSGAKHDLKKNSPKLY